VSGKIRHISLLEAISQGRFAGGKYIYFQSNLFCREPLLHLPGHKKPVVAVKFNPLIYEHRFSEPSHSCPSVSTIDCFNKQNNNRASDGEKIGVHSNKVMMLPSLPYRLIFAVVCLDSVVIYDTSQTVPIAVFSNFHFGSLTDVAWYLVFPHKIIRLMIIFFQVA
jgi:chromatin assembly factor 1 subunit B